MLQVYPLDEGVTAKWTTESYGQSVPLTEPSSAVVNGRLQVVTFENPPTIEDVDPNSVMWVSKYTFSVA